MIATKLSKAYNYLFSMPKNIPTVFFTCHNEFQGPLKCSCTLWNLWLFLPSLYNVLAEINIHIIQKKCPPEWRICVQVRLVRRGARAALGRSYCLFCLSALLALQVMASHKNLGKALPSLPSSDQSCGNLWLWEQESPEIQAKVNIGKHHHLVQTPGEVYRCLA